MPKESQPPTRKITLGDVALLAGVSAGAVSAVLNNLAEERGIGPLAANRIREAARKLGYKPNISARLMRRGSERQPLVIALVTSYEAPEGVISHAMSLIHHLQKTKAGKEHILQVVIEMFSVGRLKELPGLLSGAGFNLAIITNTSPEDDEFLRLNRFSYPAIMLNRQIPGLPGVVDSPHMGAEAAHILTRNTPRRVAVLHGSSETQATLRRKNGFMQAASEITGKPTLEIVANGLSQKAGFEIMTEFLKTNEPPDALYCVMDTLAIGAYRALRDAGLRIPQDISVLGVGDNSSSLYMEPPLSTVGPNHKFAMDALGKMLLAHLANRDNPVSIVEIPIGTHLRESTGDSL